ncbi:MAG: tetratricopeptide repeat protein [Anaerolineae bacterium]
MPDLPSGIVTFLFTDIEGSTRLWEQHPDAMRHAMQRHDQLVEESVAQNTGVVVRPRGEGDSRFAVFARATDAVAAARDIQQALAAEPWPTPRPLRVRMALHTGEADLRAGDYYGSDVNRCARLRAVGYGGQTLLSQATFGLVRDALPERVTLCDLGEHRLKDLQRAEHVFELDVAGLPAEFPPLQSIDAFPNNLPIQLTSFVGRDKELKEVGQLLAATHLLTLTGPGGTGKTRLALQLAAEDLESFPDGVWLVELAPVADPLLVTQAVAEVLGLPPGGRQVQEVLGDFLRPKKLLLVLDNCEHLIEECAALASKLLRACPHLKILSTSREPLGIAGETIYRVPSLDLPDSPGLSAAQLSGYSAVRLFAERATAVKPGFRLTAGTATAVAQICLRLDGIPLAIELAAARVKALSPEQIATRLDDRFRLLTGGSRTALPRQQTLRALIDWSYELLAEPERALLRRLSVFVGNWTVEAAEQVCGDQEAPITLEPVDVLDLLVRLVDRSLVTADETDERETRYRFLETIRQYARDKLLESGEAELLRDRHMQYYERLTAECAPQLFGPMAPVTNKRLQEEEGNLLATMTWASERAPALALRIAGNLLQFRGQAAHLAGMRPALEAALTRLDTLPAVDGAAARERERVRALGLTALGQVKMGQGNMKDATVSLQQGVALARTVDDQRLLAHGLLNLGTMFALMGNFEAADATINEGIEVASASGSKGYLSFGLGVRGQARAQRGDYAGARADLVEALRVATEVGDRSGLGMGKSTLARIDMLQGRYAEAMALLEEALALLQETRDWVFENLARSGIADAHRQMGDYAQAAALYRQVIRHHQLAGNRGGIARCFECLAFMQVQQATAGPAGQRAEYLCRAARLFGAAEAMRETSGAHMGAGEPEEYAPFVSQLRALMDERDREAAWADGRRMTVEQVLDAA